MSLRLLDDRFAPITSEIGFLECDAETAKESYLAWVGPIQAERKIELTERKIEGDFVSKIMSLLPLTSIESRRSLFLPTRSQWTAYFDNGWQGTDAYSTVSFLCQRIGCRGLRAVSVSDTFKETATGARGRYGATILEIYAPNDGGCTFLNTQRSVFAANDGGRWKFEANGVPLPFEDLERYESRRIQDRFNSESLDRYLGHLGIHFFSAAFYETSEPAVLISRNGPSAAGLKIYSLADARSNY